MSTLAIERTTRPHRWPWPRFLRRLGLLVMITLGVGGGYLTVIEPWHLNWGATRSEIQHTWPGDELLPQPGFVSTRAVTVNAPADAIWPWIVQMGQGRGGLYSYTFLENLVGSDLHNANRIHPEWQTLRVGDAIRPIPEVWLGITNTPKWEVVTLVPNQVVVFQGWGAFILEPIDGQRTRLIVRSRGTSPLASMEPFNFIMGRRTMLGIKERAEGTVRPLLLDVAEVLLWAVAFSASLVAGSWVLVRTAWQPALALLLGAITVLLLLLFARPPLWGSLVLDLALLGALVWVRRSGPRRSTP